MKFREIKIIPQGHTASENRIKLSNPNMKAQGLPTVLCCCPTHLCALKGDRQKWEETGRWDVDSISGSLLKLG